jgi:predicted nuclease with RNAse H fold
MRKLTERGMNLGRILENRGFKVIEVYPGGAQDILGVPRKQRGLEMLRIGLERLGVRGLNDRMSDHELDAVTCALVGKLFLEKKSVTYGTSERGIVMPKGEKSKADGR